jgi:hypothetical protein
VPSSPVILQIRVPRQNEYTPEAAVALFAGFTKILKNPSFTEKLFKKPCPCLIMEIASFGQQIGFFAVVEEPLLPFFESQLLAAYPSAVMAKSPNFCADWETSKLKFGQLVQQNTYYYPFKTFRQFTDLDPLSSVLAVLSKAGADDKILIQIVLESPGFNWQGSAQSAVTKGIVISETERQPLPGEAAIKEKIQETGLRVGIRIAATSERLLGDLIGSFAAFSRGDGNSLGFQKPTFWQSDKLLKAILFHKPGLTPRWQVLSISELATIWHFPTGTANIPNLAWGRTVVSEAPENLPAATGLTDEQKAEVNFFAKTEFKNQLVTFGIKQSDRRRHIYSIGKTGTGKTWMLANMAIDDLKKKRGLAVIDPHGDLCEILLNYIPSHRINDVCYLNPADREHPFSINMLEVQSPPQAELIASGIVSIFYKLYAFSWGPRLEYILRNVLLTLTQIPNSTLIDVVRILTDKRFRDESLRKIQDRVLLDFWDNEFARMPDKLREEAISPILNKVGQFVTSPLIRQIIGRPKSTVDLEKIMNEGKILIVNLSQGRLGEDNSALLGAMIITKLQLAAMNRVEIPEPQRRDFYLYVDEFQNFATDSFIKILSEARKYRLCLTLANQYMAQIPEEIRKAILGNAGTLISFIVGAEDAAILEKEFAGVYTQNDLVSLSNFQVVLKLMIDNLTSRPFFAYTLPLPKSVNQNRDKVIRVSEERFSYKT